MRLTIVLGACMSWVMLPNTLAGTSGPDWQHEM